MYACMYACMHACMYECTYARMYACMHVCTYVRIPFCPIKRRSEATRGFIDYAKRNCPIHSLLSGAPRIFMASNDKR